MGSDNSKNLKEAQKNVPDSSFEANEDVMFLRVSPNNKVLAVGTRTQIRLYNPQDN